MKSNCDVGPDVPGGGAARRIVSFVLMVVMGGLLHLGEVEARARRVEVGNCLGADNVVGGDYVAVVKDSHVETGRGPVELPVGGNLLYPALAADGQRFAGVGNRDDRAYELMNAAWNERGMAFGVNAVIYDVRDQLRIVWGPGTPTGSQGWRYMADDGHLVTGDESYADVANHLWEYTVRGDVRCGQGGDEEGLQCLIRGRRVLVEPGIIRFIDFDRTGDMVALAWVRQDTRSCGLLWASVQELDALPTYEIPVGPGPEPKPEPKPEPPPPPVQEPASLFEDVKAVRATVEGQPTSAQLGAMLNAVAWKHRAEGWGLSKKPGGHNCPTPPPAAVLIACDILHHKPTNMLYDVFGSVEAGAVPQWGKAGPPLTPDREWLAPVQPTTEPEPEPEPEPSPEPELLRRIEVLESAVISLMAKVEALEQRPNGVPEERVNELLGQAISNLRVVGRSEPAGWGMFSHSHQIEFPVLWVR